MGDVCLNNGSFNKPRGGQEEISPKSGNSVLENFLPVFVKSFRTAIMVRIIWI
jgi:hypothetical protein